jgi:hypothetical protein
VLFPHTVDKLSRPLPIFLDHFRGDVFCKAERRGATRPGVCAPRSAASACSVFVVGTRTVALVVGDGFINQGLNDLRLGLRGLRLSQEGSDRNREHEDPKATCGRIHSIAIVLTGIGDCFSSEGADLPFDRFGGCAGGCCPPARASAT